MTWIIVLALGIATFTAIGVVIVYYVRLRQLRRQYQQLLKEQSQSKK